MSKPKIPINYLVKDLPDFVGIIRAYQNLVKRGPSMKEVRRFKKCGFARSLSFGGLIGGYLAAIIYLRHPEFF